MTAYTHDVLIVAPATLQAEANELALAVGESPSDRETFGSITGTNASGDPVLIANAAFTLNLLVKVNPASGPITFPSYVPAEGEEGAGNPALAEAARSVLRIYNEADPRPHQTGELLAIIHTGDVAAAMALAGVARD